MGGIWSDNHARTLAPLLLFPTDGHFPVNSNDNLNRMVSMDWHNAVRASNEKESTFP